LSMSMELFVILALNRAPDIEAWDRALRVREIPARVVSRVELNSYSGFLSLVVKDQESGMYFRRDDYSDLRSHYESLAEIGMDRPVVYTLGYGGHFYECAAAFYAAAALVAEFGGKAFEPQGRVFMNLEQLIEAGDTCYASAGNADNG
jgi:hypothetical protein